MVLTTRGRKQFQVAPGYLRFASSLRRVALLRESPRLLLALPVLNMLALIGARTVHSPAIATSRRRDRMALR